jgi:hypothetical protein
MPISESQLETWSRQGSVTQSAATYQTLRGALERSDAPYANRSYTAFLQGSYGNDTNIYADSDVDIVMRLDSVYYADTSALPAADLATYRADFSAAEYSWQQFREEVVAQLRKVYGSAVTPGKKAIAVAGNGSRRDADVLPAAEYRRYFAYSASWSQRYAEGICFWLPDGSQIVNYPKLHSSHCTAKHQRTGSRFKPTVRILKNWRNAMIAEGRIASDLAPSYFVEGMLYNVPDVQFGPNWSATVVNAINWLSACDRDTLVCANEQYLLLHPNSPVTWRAEKFEAFLAAMIASWNGS